MKLNIDERLLARAGGGLQEASPESAAVLPARAQRCRALLRDAIDLLTGEVQIPFSATLPLGRSTRYSNSSFCLSQLTRKIRSGAMPEISGVQLE